MRFGARSIVTASLAAAGLCMSTAVSASASPAAPPVCGDIVGFAGPGLTSVGVVCVSVSNGQVMGYDGVVEGELTYQSTWVNQCNAAQTVCSIVPGTTVPYLVTP